MSALTGEAIDWLRSCVRHDDMQALWSVGCQALH